MSDEKMLHQLIDLSALDEEDRQKYHEAVPFMNDAERMYVGLDLWESIMEMLHRRAITEMEAMVWEMAEEEKVSYTPQDFQHVHDRVMNDFLEEKMQVHDTDELARLRTNLENLGHSAV